MRKTRLSKAKLINQIKLMYHSLPIKNFENLDNLLTHKYLSDKPYSWSYAFYKSLRKGEIDGDIGLNWYGDSVPYLYHQILNESGGDDFYCFKGEYK